MHIAVIFLNSLTVILSFLAFDFSVFLIFFVVIYGIGIFIALGNKVYKLRVIALISNIVFVIIGIFILMDVFFGDISLQDIKKRLVYGSFVLYIFIIVPSANLYLFRIKKRSVNI